VTNVSGTSAIGNNASANTNHVVVTGAGSILNNIGTLYIGAAGSANELDILNGGVFMDTAGAIGQSGSSSNNIVQVSGSGSVWTNSSSLYVGNGGWHNTLIVTNGGKVSSAGNSAVGNGPNGMSNLVVITGAGSSWNCGGYFYLSYIDRGRHQFLVSDGGDFNCSSWLDIGVYSSSNTFTVADAGSTVQCQFYRMGYASAANQCVVSNGATLAVLSPGQPTTVEGTFTTASVTGAGSVWTNAGDLDFGQYSNTLAITGGGRLVEANGYIENGSGKPNAVTVAGANSLWKNSGDLHVADLGAQLIITNGGVVSDVNGYLGDNSGLFKANSLYVSSGTQTNLIFFNGGTLQSGTTSYGTELPFVVGDGTDAATFQMLNNGTHTFPDGLFISSNATLTGTGTVDADITINNGGTIAPGTNSLAGIGVNGNLTFNAGSTNFMKVNATGLPGIEPSDTISGVGNLVYGGTLSLTNINLSGILTGSVYSFQLFSASNYSGAFNSLVPAVPLSQPWLHLRWDTNELNVDGVLRIFPAASPPPVVSGTAISGGSLFINAGSGCAYDPCWLLTCSNLAAPVWSCVGTNSFDVNGNLTFTNTVSTGEPSRYFKLQVN